MNNRRPPTPAALSRSLRQEAGFGCCFCGHPFIQDHHIVPWAEDQHFRPEDMMVVCGNCHPLCTCGAISVVDQRKAKKRPRNIVEGECRGQLYVNSKELVVKLGNGTAINTPNLLIIRDQVNLGAKLDNSDGRVLLSARICGPRGEYLGVLNENEWRMSPEATWDFEAAPLHATVRHAKGDIRFEVDTRHNEVAVTGRWYCDGVKLDFSRSHVRLGSNSINGAVASNCYCLYAVV